MALSFACEENLDIILCPKESAAFAFSFTFAFHQVSPEVATELANGFPCESPPTRFGVAVGHVDGQGGLKIAHVGNIGSDNVLPSIITGGICVSAVILIMIGTVNSKCHVGSSCAPWISRATSP